MKDTSMKSLEKVEMIGDPPPDPLTFGMVLLHTSRADCPGTRIISFIEANLEQHLGDL